jgi:hypothetical protein
VRLEVSSVGGKELFAKPGARSFADRDVTSLVPGGAIGSGMFASFARYLFVQGKGTLRYRHKDNLPWHDNAVRWDFRLSRQESSLKLEAAGSSAMVAARGSFWFDAITLDLIRLEVHGDGMPEVLQLDDAATRTDYARTHIGDSDALLPRRSELTLIYFSGRTSRDVIEFSQCHEYRAESKIEFDH